MEKAIAVKAYEPASELAEGRIRVCLDGCAGSAKEFGKLARSERDLGDNAHRATATTFDRPEQVRIRAGIGDSYRAISRHNFRLQ
jgi:hypothetical protein